MEYTIIAYSLYLALTIGLTIWVASTLFKNGKVFLVEIFLQPQGICRQCQQTPCGWFLSH